MHLLCLSFSVPGAVSSRRPDTPLWLPAAAQGNARDELPESLLGTMRLCNVRTVVPCESSATASELPTLLRSSCSPCSYRAVYVKAVNRRFVGALQIDLSTASYLDVNTGTIHPKS